MRKILPYDILYYYKNVLNSLRIIDELFAVARY
jgi:hypothetical protein